MNLVDTYIRIIKRQSNSDCKLPTLAETYKNVLVKEAERDKQMNQATLISSEPLQENNFDANTFIGFKPWTDSQKSLFEEIPIRGCGKGEASIASLLTNLTDVNDLKNHISGQSESFDVFYPSDTKKFKFEVKEVTLDPHVRIGKEGMSFTNKVISEVQQILRFLELQYFSTDIDSRNRINEAIINKLSPLTQPVQLTKRGTPSISKKTALKIAQYEEDKKNRSEWTLDKYINAILDVTAGEARTTGELPFSLFTPGKRPRFREGNRRKYVFISIPDLLTYIEELAETSDDSASPTNSTAFKLKNTLRKLYTTSDMTDKDVQEIDQEADNIDQKLSALTCHKAAGKCKSAEDFYRSTKSKNLKFRINRINEIKDKSVAGLFPPDITGIFFVNPNGYQYVPKNEISSKIKIVTITQGGPKISPTQPLAT